MSVTTMCRKEDLGALYDEDMSERYGTDIWLRTEHEGMVLATGEINGYDDSDFTATIWDPDREEARVIVYASTRGWSYPNSAEVDASPKIFAAYEKWRAAIEKGRRRLARDRVLAMYDRAGLSEAEGDRLRVLFTRHSRGPLYDGVVENRPAHDALFRLLESEHGGRLRSPFRQSLAAQIRAWAGDEKPEYDSPLSPRQWRSLTRGSRGGPPPEGPGF